MDSRSVYSLSVLPPLDDSSEEPNTRIQAALREFILAFQIDNTFVYRLVWSLATLEQPADGDIETRFDRMRWSGNTTAMLTLRI